MSNHDPMKIAVFTGPKQVEVWQEPRPAPGPGQALVRLRACGVCTMEQRLYLGVTNFYPAAVGHEPAGEVVSVAEDVVSVKPGDHVIVSLLPRCGQCYFCRMGESDKCVTRPARKPGEMMRIGGFAEYVVAYGYQLYKISPDVDWAEASLGEPLACVVHSLNKLNIQFGEDVLVVGGGTMGQLHVLLARLRGARVMLSETLEDKLQVGVTHGAQIGINPLKQNLEAVVKEYTDGRGVDALFITVGGANVAEQALKTLRKGGRALFYSAYYPPVTIPVDPDWIHHSQVALHGAVNQTPSDWMQVSQLLSKRLIDVKHVVSGRFPLDAIGDAMKQATNGQTFRIVMEMNG